MNIQEIAKLAGVSVSTVSKVMNGKDKDISEKTRKKVFRSLKILVICLMRNIERKRKIDQSIYRFDN